MKQVRCLCALFIVTLITISLPAFAENSSSQTQSLPEIHLLVDTSGSMRATDPLNLRVKAIQMFIFLIKQKALLQIQTFATDTQSMMPLKPVTVDYQSRFLRNSSKINSNGAWTDIDNALNAANNSWGKGKKVIILLTDGKVDLDSKFRTTQSTNRLIESTIPNLQKKGVQLFTIGFSNNIDKNLLDTLATKTNGISQVATTSKEVDTALYTLFTAIINVNGASIHKNKDSTRDINIDKSIHDLFLIFKTTENIAQLFLTDPKGSKKSILSLSKKNVSTSNFALVEINHPTSGKWILMGPQQEIERSIIYTDINLVANFASGAYFQGEEIDLESYFTQSGKLIADPIMVETASVKAVLQSSNNSYKYLIPYRNKGLFKKKIYLDNPIGAYRLVLTAENKFLSRELQFMLEVHASPVKIQITKDSFVIDLIRTDLIKEDSVNVKLDTPSLKLPGIKNDASWVVNLLPLCSNPSLIPKASVLIAAQTVSGRTISLKLKIPNDACAQISESTFPGAHLLNPSLIPDMKINLKKYITTKDNFLFKLLFYSIIILLILIISLMILTLIKNKKYKKEISQIKEQLQSENNYEQL